LGRFRNELLTAEEGLHDKRRLMLHQFHARFPSFPVYFVTTRLPKKLAAKPERLLFDDVSMHSLAKLYDEGKDQVPKNRRWYGLVIKWPYRKRPVVFSNVGDSNATGTRLLCRTENGVYCLEDLGDLVRRLKWQPQQYEIR
jgi:hypothetical protein